MLENNVTVESIYQIMQQKLHGIIPDVELRIKAKLVYEIEKLKKERNAVILGHNYMEPALYHTIPDFKGDSLELSRKAAETDADIIVFCGVRFMAETAKILNPTKTVLIPSPKAGCSLAESITAADVRILKQMYPGVPVVTYINTYADVKAESDICCTSGNAAAIVSSFKDSAVIFLPDLYLAGNVAKELGRKLVVPTKTSKGIRKPDENIDNAIIGWQGKCEVHEQFTVDDIHRAREKFSDAIVLAHPECSPEVTAAADFTGSTSAMIRYVQQSSAKHYLLLTECSMADNIAAENPEKEMIRLCSVRCPHMKEITLEETLKSLQMTQYVVEVPEEIRVKALAAVERMLSFK